MSSLFIEHRTSNPTVEGSNRVGDAIPLDGQQNLREVDPSG